jgi:hypothetical protein
VTLEFHKLTGQIDQMGEYLANQELDNESKTEIALQILAAYADEAFLPHIHERVQDAVEKDAGYRGARPLDEPIMNTYPCAPLPETATIVATDGSQIYPRQHGAMHYYLINIGTIILPHGSGQPPEVFSQPYLFYERELVYPQGSGPISPATVNARRTVAEMAALAEHAWNQRGEVRPLLALLDGPLLFVMGTEVPERDQLRKVYFSAMNRLLEVQASLVGYTARPNSSFLVRTLHLLDIPPEEVSRGSLAHSGRLEGLFDVQIYNHLLEPGERTALFVQMSPQNKEFRQRGGEALEIAFFYLNVTGPEEPPHIARVEVPMWVAQNRELIAELQALIYQQCQQITKRYPYVLMRADELAVVKGDEQYQLNMMIRVAMTRHGLDASESEKQASKDVARGHKRRFEVG